MANDMLEASETASSETLERLQRAVFLLGALLVCASVAGISIASRAPNVLFTGIQSYLLWCAVASVIQHFFIRLEAADTRAASPGRSPALPGFARRWQWVLLFAGILLIAVFSEREAPAMAPLSAASPVVLRLATVFFLAFGCALYFFANFAAAVQSRLRSSMLDPVLHLARVAFWACLAASGIVFLFLSIGRDFSAWLGWPLVALTALLIFDPLARLGLRFYQPRTLRGVPAPAGNSLLLDAVFGHGHGVGGAIKQFERLAGTKVKEMWMLQFLRQTSGIILAAALLLGWFSTCLTAVPAGSRGVSVLLGRYQSRVLNPGLHLTFPWPIEELVIVETEKVRSISLGFDKDLSGPVLWNEPHAEGEKNLLVGNGESLLTISVPILYRISDPVAYLKTSKDAEEALADLGERKLMLVVGSRDSFNIMTDGREEIARALKAGLQEEIDRLQLGLEIVFVGLQDVHPPVDVAPAYQEVVSAEEQKETMIDQAKAYTAGALPEAMAAANRLKVLAQANYTERVSQATGEAARFSAIVSAWQENPALFHTRLRLDAIQESLGKSIKTIVGIPAGVPKEFYLDLRNTSDLPPP